MSDSHEILSSKVADSMMQRIIDNEYRAGNFLPSERVLQDEYQVSRTVIREAIKLLVARGLVTTSSRQGTLVNPDLSGPLTDTMRIAFYRSKVYVEDVLDIRLMLEPQIARRAAENATSAQTRRLLEIAKEFELIPIMQSKGDYEQMRIQWLAKDRELHVLLAESTQNPVLPLLIEAIVGQIWHSAELIKQSISQTHHDIVIQHHAEIAQFVAAKDPANAEAAMRRHLEYTRDYLPVLRKRLQDIE